MEKEKHSARVIGIEYLKVFCELIFGPELSAPEVNLTEVIKTVGDFREMVEKLLKSADDLPEELELALLVLQSALQFHSFHSPSPNKE